MPAQADSKLDTPAAGSWLVGEGSVWSGRYEGKRQKGGWPRPLRSRQSQQCCQTLRVLARHCAYCRQHSRGSAQGARTHSHQLLVILQVSWGVRLLQDGVGAGMQLSGMPPISICLDHSAVESSSVCRHVQQC